MLLLLALEYKNSRARWYPELTPLPRLSNWLISLIIYFRAQQFRFVPTRNTKRKRVRIFLDAENYILVNSTVFSIYSPRCRGKNNFKSDYLYTCNYLRTFYRMVVHALCHRYRYRYRVQRDFDVGHRLCFRKNVVYKKRTSNNNNNNNDIVHTCFESKRTQQSTTFNLTAIPQFGCSTMTNTFSLRPKILIALSPYYTY